AMMTKFRTLPSDATLQTAIDELLAGAQQDFPVVDQNHFRGLLRRSDLVEALRKDGPQARVDSALTRIESGLREEDVLRESLEHMRQKNCQSLPVFRDGQLV